MTVILCAVTPAIIAAPVRIVITPAVPVRIVITVSVPVVGMIPVIIPAVTMPVPGIVKTRIAVIPPVPAAPGRIVPPIGRGPKRIKMNIIIPQITIVVGVVNHFIRFFVVLFQNVLVGLFFIHSIICLYMTGDCILRHQYFCVTTGE